MLGPALLAALCASGNLARPAEIEVVGPVRDLVVSLGSAGEARLLGELLPGERVRLAVPLPARDATSVPPEIRWSGGAGVDPDPEGLAGRGRARFVGWKTDVASARIEELAPGLRARSRPPLAPPEILLPRASLALLPACLVIGLALRRRPWSAAWFALAGSSALLLLGWPRGGRAEREVTVLDGDAQSSAGLSLTATWERAQLSPEDLDDSRVETSKEEARLVWTGPFSSSEPWSAFAPGSAIYVERAIDVGEQPFRREENRGRELAETWVREDGIWTARGPWALGAPLPPSRTGSAPPGWIVSGLPQGVPVLIGRAAAPERSDRAIWVRETGF